MRKMYLKPGNDNQRYVIEEENGKPLYVLEWKKQGILKECYYIKTENKQIIGQIKSHHVLFTPGKLPVTEVILPDICTFQLKKEIIGLEDTISLENHDFLVEGPLTSHHFTLYYKDIKLADFNTSDSYSFCCDNIRFEKLVASFAFAWILTK